jgi:hypothetical protein
METPERARDEHFPKGFLLDLNWRLFRKEEQKEGHRISLEIAERRGQSAQIKGEIHFHRSPMAKPRWEFSLNIKKEGRK